MSLRYPASRLPRPHQQGYTLLEILVALFIGIFLLTGLFTILQNTRRSSSNQTALTQLQDEQRMAMSLLNDVIQNAGYYDATTTSATVALPAVAASTYATAYAIAKTQGISGSDSTTDMILVRYATNGTTSLTPDNLENCNGSTSTAATTFISTFFIAQMPSSTTYALYCSLDGTNSTTTGAPLVTGVENMQIYYGVSTVAGANNVDTYMTATQVQAAGAWLNVTSVRVTLGFVNPLYKQAGYTLASSQYVYLTRVIPLQARTGVTASAQSL